MSAHKQEGEWESFRQEEDNARHAHLTNEDVAAMRQKLIDAESCACNLLPPNFLAMLMDLLPLLHA
jgi:hypothetical protein